MNWRPILFSACCTAALLAGGPAMAADDLLDAPEISIAAAKAGGQGFYLRGDLGYAPWTDEGDASLQLFDGDTFDFNADSSKPFSGSLGIGYQINDMVRADLTGDYFDGRFDGSGQADIPCAGEAAGTSCAGDLRASYKAVGVMANGYVDLATVAGLTPYVGAGLGVTQLRWDDVALRTDCVTGTAACSGAAPVDQAFDGETSWRLTYALMAGVSYDMTERLKLDVGYRYSKIGDGDMFARGGVDGRDDGLGRHELRAGLRFSLW
ncbi:outer membrane protein [Pararhizobium gei]|uniref:outer membrane protein n=1 Tax=Pararhizobium gei TaxID=1395951 RepID=UPI0023D99B1D|nr:outer membrane protein [Rhizobium gei]